MKTFNQIETLAEFCARDGDLRGCVIQGLDLSKCDVTAAQLAGAVFLGCTFPDKANLECQLVANGAIVFPKLPNLPYHPYRPRLYTREELMEGYAPTNDQSVDKKIYEHFVAQGRDKPNIMEALAQRLHDHAIDDALGDLLEGRDGKGVKKVVGIMGGHGKLRTDPFFRKAADVARGLTQNGYFVASGGGPGIMEATNLGAYLANVSDSDYEWAFDTLAKAPHYTDEGFMETAQAVVDRFPDGAESLAVPTWFYGHEPSNLFAQHIAKYFSNSIREDGLLAIARHGVVFAPGSAGTTQEIFMDATQNHYGTLKHISPMVFLGTERYSKETQLFPLVQALSEGRDYGEMLLLSDEPDDVVNYLCKSGPKSC